MTELNVDGMALAPGVIETIASIAVNEVEGVASVGSSNTTGIRSVFAGKSSMQGIEVTLDEDENLSITVHIDAYYGYVLPELATQVRQAVVDAVAGQVGISVNTVDVYIDAIQFTG